MKTSDFEHVYMHYRDMVMSIAYDVLKDYHLAQDVCQEVFFKLSKTRRDELTISENTKNYLAVIAHNRAVDYYRKRKRLGELSINGVPDSGSEMSLNEIIDQRGVLSKVFSDLRENHPDWYEVIIHVCFYEESGVTAARELGIPVSTLRTRYHRARKYVNKEYGKDFHHFME